MSNAVLIPPAGAKGDVLGEQVAIEATHVTPLLRCILLIPLVPDQTDDSVSATSVMINMLSHS